MAKKTKAEQAELTETETPEQRAGEEFLPPPDPPAVPSPPTEPPAPDAVEDIAQKGAQPEDGTVVRELILAPETRPNPVEPPPEIP
jgi:hypothetical protein